MTRQKKRHTFQPALTSVAANKPLGSWSLGWATPDGLGKLTSNGRGVPLTAISTGVNQTGSVTGSVKFNQSVNR